MEAGGTVEFGPVSVVDGTLLVVDGLLVVGALFVAGGVGAGGVTLSGAHIDTGCMSKRLVPEAHTCHAPDSGGATTVIEIGPPFGPDGAEPA
jgi:hypothetical protein